MSNAAVESRPRVVQPPEIREHQIPTPGSKPYIAIEGFDGCLWFCESGTSKIGRFDPKTTTFTEFDLPTPNATPIGITSAATAITGSAKRPRNRIGRITPQGKVTEFPLPTPNAGPDAMLLGPDGNVWFSETEVSQIGRITPDGTITEFKDGITPGCKPLSIVVRDGALWFSEASGNNIGRIDDAGQGHRVSNPEQRQPAARHHRASGRLDLVRRDLDERARPHRPRRQASPNIR